MSEKPKMKYRASVVRSPGTGKVLLRPCVVDRASVSLEEVVDYALTRGFVRGRVQETCGTLNGLFEAIQSLLREGKSVNLGGWLRVYGTLTGTLDPAGQLGRGNDYRLCLVAGDRLKCRREDFAWKRVEAR